MKNQRGLTLVELLLSVTLMGTVMMGVSNVSTQATKLAKTRNQEVNTQTDMTYVFKRIEFILQKYLAENDILIFSTSFVVNTSQNSATATLIINRRDPTTGVVSELDRLTFVHYQDNETLNTLSFNNAPQGQFSAGGFEPYARLTDLNQNGQIDSSDRTQHANCINDYRLCTVGTQPLFFEISPTRNDILYISYRASRRNSNTGMKKFLGPGITKPIYLRSAATGA